MAAYSDIWNPNIIPDDHLPDGFERVFYRGRWRDVSPARKEDGQWVVFMYRVHDGDCPNWAWCRSKAHAEEVREKFLGLIRDGKEADAIALWELFQ